REGAIDTRSKTQISMLIRRAGLNKSHVDGELPGTKQVFNLAQKNRRVVCPGFGNRAADVAAQEQAVVTKMPLVFRTRVSRFAKREHVTQFNVAEFRGPLHQGVDKRLRSTAALFEPDAVPGLHYF